MSTLTTVSMCVPETPEEGKNVFEIVGYSKHKGMGHDASSFIRSRTFSVGGHNWSIRYYPDGYVRNNTEEFYIVTVMKQAREVEIKRGPKIAVPPSDIAQHLGKLLEEGEQAYVTFSVGDHTFTAHRVVLTTRSPVFKAELHGPMREARAQEVVTIQGMQPAVFKALLHFIYTDSMPLMDGLEGNDRREVICHLLVAADRYGVDRLKLMCQSILAEDLDAQNVAATLVLADIHHCNMLKDACIEFVFSSTTEDAAATKGLKGQKTSNPFIKMIHYFKKC